MRRLNPTRTRHGTPGTRRPTQTNPYSPLPWGAVVPWGAELGDTANEHQARRHRTAPGRRAAHTGAIRHGATVPDVQVTETTAVSDNATRPGRFGCQGSLLPL